MKVLPDGVQYKVIKEGSGKKPTLKDGINVNDRITRVEDKEIGNNYADGKPRKLLLSKALPGRQQVPPLLAEGSKRQIVMSTRPSIGPTRPASVSSWR